MPSYTSYMRQMAVLDANDNEIESWITVKGNHIPILKGQSKEDAVKAFIEKKEGRKTAYKESRANFRTAAKERDKVIKAIGTYTQKTGKEDIHLEAQKKRLEKTMTHESNVMSKIRKEEEKERTLSLAEKARKRKELAEKRLEKAEPITKYGDIQSEKKDYTIAHKDKSGNTTIIAEVSHHDIGEKEDKSYNEKGLYQDALNELDDQIADKEKELENIHLAMTQNAEAGYFDIASENMGDLEFVKGQLNELKKKREKLAGSSKKN